MTCKTIYMFIPKIQQSLQTKMLSPYGALTCTLLLENIRGTNRYKSKCLIKKCWDPPCNLRRNCNKSTVNKSQKNFNLITIILIFFIFTVITYVIYTKGDGSGTWSVKVGLSPSKDLRYLLQWKPCKNDEKCFYFILEALFVLKIFKFLSWPFGHADKTAWSER